MSIFCFFFNDTATTEIYTLSLHDALPIYMASTDISLHNKVPVAHDEHDHEHDHHDQPFIFKYIFSQDHKVIAKDRKSTRLNSSHANISYAVFCLKKKKTS